MVQQKFISLRHLWASHRVSLRDNTCIFISLKWFEPYKKRPYGIARRTCTWSACHGRAEASTHISIVWLHESITSRVPSAPCTCSCAKEMPYHCGVLFGLGSSESTVVRKYSCAKLVLGPLLVLVQLCERNGQPHGSRSKDAVTNDANMKSDYDHNACCFLSLLKMIMSIIVSRARVLSIPYCARRMLPMQRPMQSVMPVL